MGEKSNEKRASISKLNFDSSLITKAVIHFLQQYMTETLAKRLIGIVLIIAGMPNATIIENTGLSVRSIQRLKKQMESGTADDLFALGYERSGKTSKVKGLESAIVHELETNNYHTRQQVADMVYAKFGIIWSVSAVGKFLKKNASEN